jgi:hypothetical protein
MRSQPQGDDGAATPLRFLGPSRRNADPARRNIEPEAPPSFTAGERLAVSSELAGDDRRQRRPSMLRLSLLLILLFFAGIGAVTVYHAVAGVLPG